MTSDGVPVEIEVHLPDAEATSALGRAVGAGGLRAGDCLALLGEVGAGKTTFVRALAVGLGVEDPEAVSSPTYLLAIEHPGDPPLIHVDAYLPEKTRAFLLDGGIDYVLTDARGVLAVEWADRIGDLLPEERRLTIEFGPAGDDLLAQSGRHARLRFEERSFPWLRDAVSGL